MAAYGYPGVFPGGFTTGYINIGAVQKDKSGTESGYPGVFPGGLTTGYVNIGAVQKDVASATTRPLPQRALAGPFVGPFRGAF